ncbi:MAG: molybdopterin-dependent oxidoreductase [Candidatus Krumholzibacteria bacterium]|nr:molybdopterin-dependent oxidoreductase [Candidatus Krumholzibacteria bacterium]
MSEITNYCSLCSLACPVIFRGGKRGPIFSKDSILTIDWDTREESKYGGSLCARGNAAVEFVSHPKRINYPFVLGERTGIDAAVKETAKSLSAIKNKSGGEKIGVLIGENLTNEEAALALKFAREVIGTSKVELFAPDDTPLFRSWLGCDLSGLSPSTEKPSGTRQVFLMIGDSFSEHPCTAKPVLAAKNSGRGNEIIVISPEISHTAWFAGRHLRCRPGGEAAVVAGILKSVAQTTANGLVPELKKLMDGIEWNDIERLGGVKKDAIESAATSILGAVNIETYVSNIFGRFAMPGLVSLFAEALTAICPGDSKFDAQFVQQNSWGIYSVLAAGETTPFLSKLEGDEVEALVILGLDIFSAYPAGPIENALREKKFTVASQMFFGQTASRANVVIPAACLMEKKGTVSPSFGEDLVREDVIDPPGGVLTDGEFLVALAREMGSDLSGSVDVVRKTSRGSSGEGVVADWTAFSNTIRGLDASDLVLIPWSEAVHVADGSTSRNLHWSEVTCPEPRLYVSKEIMDKLDLTENDLVRVSSEGGETMLPVEATEKLQGGTVAATIHFPSVRKLFPWKLDDRRGEVLLAPVPVNLDSQSEKS